MILFYQICAARGYRWSATNGQANGRWRGLRGPEAGFDPGLTDTAATRGAADRGRIGVRRGSGEGDDGDGGEDLDGGYYGVPKRDLILGLQILLQRGVLRIAAGLEYGADLVKEMTAMEVKISASGYEQCAAWREGTHDDLVFAVALACWNAQNAYPNDPAGGEQWWTNQHQADAARIFRKGGKDKKDKK